MELFPLHSHKEWLQDCAGLLNSEWPRSIAARLYSLEKSCDDLPCSLVLVSENKVVGHSRLASVQGIKNSCLLESVVVPKDLRGKGLGRKLMDKTEEYAKSSGFQTIFLNTIDKQEFYRHLGYQDSGPVASLGANAHLIPDSLIAKMMNVGMSHTPDTAKKEVAVAELPPPDTSPPPPPPPPIPPPPPAPAPADDDRHVIRLSRNSVTWMRKDLP
ncbi:N-alpha-acetyltransferase 80-like [Haliotis rufescens]|uniref:N-alpha-acetyltransferase 80-like n=1 Tax=Haliotis rufescens TaxID=6454 RepID=UPI00201EE133|nr:N-alpha-acetyltransferase 80-like [Haliotis rufescens]